MTKKKSKKKEQDSADFNVELGFHWAAAKTIEKVDEHCEQGDLFILPVIGISWFKVPCMTLPELCPAKFRAITLAIKFIIWHVELSYIWVRKTK